MWRKTGPYRLLKVGYLSLRLLILHDFGSEHGVECVFFASFLYIDFLRDAVLSAGSGVLLRTLVYIITRNELLNRVTELYLLVANGLDYIRLIEITRNTLDLLTSQVMFHAWVEWGVKYCLVNVTFHNFAIPMCWLSCWWRSTDILLLRHFLATNSVKWNRTFSIFVRFI